MRFARRPVLEPALIAAEPLLDHQERLISAGIGVRRVRFGLEGDPRIKVQRAIGLEAEAVLGERDVAGIVAIEILAEHLVGALADAAAQRFADADALSGNPQGHVSPRFM